MSDDSVVMAKIQRAVVLKARSGERESAVWITLLRFLKVGRYPNVWELPSAFDSCKDELWGEILELLGVNLDDPQALFGLDVGYEGHSYPVQYPNLFYIERVMGGDIYRALRFKA